VQGASPFGITSRVALYQYEPCCLTEPRRAREHGRIGDDGAWGEPMTLTADRGLAGLLDWATGFGPEAVDDAVAEQVRYLLLDHAANAFGGLTSQSTTIIRRFAAGRAGNCLTVGGQSLLEEYAAFVAGTSAHALESDDTHQASSSHPGSAIFPTVLSLASMENMSFKEFSAAIVTGYEVMARIGMAATVQGQYDRGFHPTGTAGVFGATAAAASILNLETATRHSALGIALSLASGSMAFLVDGAWTKRLHPGWAAHSGLIAARLAAAGFKGPHDAIAGPDGFLHAYSNARDDRQLTEGLGELPLAIGRTSIKAHACCRYKQAPIDAVIALVEEHDLAPEQVACIRVGVLTAGWNIIAVPAEDKRRPVTVVDAQFSMPFGAAVAVLHRSAGTKEYTPQVIESPEVVAFMERVECYQSADLDEAFPSRWPAEVEIELQDGRTVSKRVDFPKGDPENPLTSHELQMKFRDLTTGIVTEVGQARMVEAIVGFGEVVEPADLARLFSNREFLEPGVAEIG
jgi:2-methylcitrate dehydratase PrpD